MTYDPAELNRKWSAATQAEAEKKLGRSLTADEEFRIWNLGSFMGLEAIDRAVYYAKSPEEIEAYLAGLPRGDPLPEEYTRRAEKTGCRHTIKRPLRAALICFAALTLLVTVPMPFEPRLRAVWPWAVGYCAVLSFVAIGVTLLGWREGWLLCVKVGVFAQSAIMLAASIIILRNNVAALGAWISFCKCVLYIEIGLFALAATKGWCNCFGGRRSPLRGPLNRSQ